MTNDEILQAAKEAGLFTRGNGYYAVCHKTEIERFAAIIEKRTIERCALVADELRHPDGYSGETLDWCAGTDHAAEAIRKLGEKE